MMGRRRVWPAAEMGIVWALMGSVSLVNVPYVTRLIMVGVVV